MCRSKFRLAAAAVFAVAGVLLANPDFLESGTTRLSNPSSPALRSHLTQKRYRIYTQRLHDHYKSLLSALTIAGQLDLLTITTPPNEVQIGYQILPKILLENAPREQRASVVAYSWPWTDKLIDDAMLEINRSVTLLAGAAKMSPLARRGTYASLVERYRQLRQQIQNIDGHIQYNHLWQNTIAERRATYDRETALLSLVVQRNAIRAWLDEAYPNRKDNTLTDLTRLHTEQDFNFVESELRERETALTRAIAAATTEIVNIPNYVRVERLPGLWIFHVAFDTDIEDQDFLASMKQAIETTWRLHDRTDEYRVQVSFRLISVEQLYPGNERPQPGSKIDLKNHLARFPRNAAILTTGALTTYVSGRAIVLGPQDIYGRILAHEMGHILGFRDNYIRGYKDLGRDGFQIMEVVADSNDLMANVNSGLVLPYHFQKLLNRLQTNAAVQARH
jgi:hypothetical protein